MTVESPAEAVPETAPVEAAPEGLSAFQDATTAYEAYSFPASEETAPEGEAAPPEVPEVPDSEAPETEPSKGEGDQPAEGEPPAEPDDLPDEEIERILRHQKGQERIERLVQNRYGNELQKARAEAERKAREAVEKEQQQWAAADDYYQKLTADDAFYDAQVARLGESKVLRWMADYKDSAAERAEARSGQNVDVEALKAEVQAEFQTAFNTAAVGEFKETAKRSLPFYGDLPDEIRSQIDGLRFDPNENWLADGFEALGKGVTKYIERLNREHSEALAEARRAGANEAIAAREQGRPVVVDPNPGEYRTWEEVELAYAEGRIPRAEFRAQMTRFGKDI